MGIRKYYQENVEVIVKEYGFKLVGEFIGYKIPMKLMDKDGYLYYTRLDNLMSFKNSDCFSKRNPYTIHNINLWCKLNDKSFELISEKFEGNNKNLIWKCLKPECGEIFPAMWCNIQRGTSCPTCAGMHKYTFKEIVELYNKYNYHIVDYKYYKDNDIVKVTEKFKVNDINNYLYDISITMVKNCIQPEIFHTNNPYTIDNIKNYLIIHNINFELLSDIYNGNSKMMLWKCKNSNCNKIFTRNWNTVLQSDSNECPFCVCSKGEYNIDGLLNTYNIYHFRQYVFPDCKHKRVLYFDFYLPDFNLCIEYQGQQHYELVDFAGKGDIWARKQLKLNQKKDQIKRDYCNNNNIKLIEIPYWDYNNIEEILIKELNIKAGDLSA